MTDTTYPTIDKDTADKLFGALGSFWNSTYSDSDFIQTYTDALGLIEKQTNINLNETVDCISRVDVPIYHTKHWYQLVLNESDKTVGQLLKYGEGAVFGLQPDSGISYEFGISPEAVAACPLPDALKDANVICNRITQPSLIMTKGVDFIISGQQIIFREDPFNNSLIAYRTNTSDGSKEIILWVYNSEWDYDFIYKHHGYLFGVDLDSSQAYKDLLNAIGDADSGFCTHKQIADALVAITDIPLVKTNNEVVEYIQTDHDDIVVITSANVYRLHGDTNILVSVGDVLQAGDYLGDGLLIFDFSSGIIPSASLLPEIEVPVEYLLIDASEPLTFSNSTEAITVTSQSGYTKITFPLTGDSTDITVFWNTLHQNGIDQEQTLAHLLDEREDPVGEPTAANLPSTINPAEFLVENVFRNNLVLVKIKSNLVGINSLDLDNTKYLRKLIPPYKAVLISTE